MDMVIIIPIIIGLIEVLKNLGMSIKYSPLLSVVLGLIFSFLCNTDIEISNIIIQGLICGLSACGLYSGSKTLIERTKNNDTNS